MTHASVFSGIGGPEVAATMLGWENLFHCEINPFGRAVLDYWYPNAKSYDDITKTDFTEWRGRVDVLTGGFPCQPFSYAGQRRGAEDDRYLWPYMFKCIDAIRPAWVVAENVGGILTMVEQGEVSEVGVQGSLFGEEDVVRGYELRETFTLERICDDLETHGYAVQPVLVPACAVGAPHRRDRVFIVGRRRDDAADTANNGLQHGTFARSEGSETGTLQGQRHSAERNVPTAANGNRGTSADTPCGGEGVPGEGGSVEGNGSDQDKQPCQRGAATEWNSRFYELLRDAADTDCRRISRFNDNREQCDQGPIGQPLPSGELSVSRNKQGRNADVPDTSSERLQGSRGQGLQESEIGRNGETYTAWDCGDTRPGICGDRWLEFPTVSPVHRGNDGLPFPLDDLTLSPAKWRTEALKAYGNAIVPQVMYEIFRAIEIAEKRNT